MIQEEEEAQEYFKETREMLQLFCLSGWIEQFQQHVGNFIQAQLAKAAKIIEKPEKQEEDMVHLHQLQCLVAGAFKRRSSYSSLTKLLLAQNLMEQSYGMAEGK